MSDSSSKHRRALASLLTLGALLAATPAAAQPVDAAEAVTRALSRNPELSASAAQLARAAAGVASEEGRYDATLVANAGLTRTRSPSLSTAGVIVSTTNLANAEVGLKKKLEWGTELQLSLGTTWQQMQTPLVNPTTSPSGVASGSTALPSSIQLGPAHGYYAKAAFTQPLLRGFGREVTLAPLDAARADQATAARSRERVASELARDALQAYWELWYAARAVGIQRATRETARRQRDEAAARRDTGGLAPADVLTFETELASAEESLVLAENDQRSRAVALARLMGESDELPEPSPEPPPSPPTSAQGREEREAALAASPEVAEKRAAYEAAVIRARTASDGYRARLDLDGYVQAQGLGNRDAAAAFEQLSGLGAVSAHVGLTYELPLENRRQRAEADKAQAEVLSARRSLEAAEQRVAAEVARGRGDEDSARSRVALAERTRDVAASSLAAEEARFRTGSSTSLQVIRARDQLRSAELRVLRARVDLVSATLALRHLRGALVGEPPTVAANIR